MNEHSNKEKEDHKKALKAAKESYKKSMERGETWDDLVKADKKRPRITHKPLQRSEDSEHISRTKKTKPNKRLILQRLDERHVAGYVDPKLQEAPRKKKSKKAKQKTNKQDKNKQLKNRKEIRKQTNRQSLEEQRRKWIEKLHEDLNTERREEAIKEQRQKALANVSADFPLDWDSVTFGNGQIIIQPFVVDVHGFKPFKTLIIEKKEARRSFNYLRTYFKEKLPKVMCYVSSLRGLVIADTIKLDKALLTLRKLEQVDDIEYVEGNSTSSKFDICCRKGKQMNESEFRRFKSEFIDYLVAKRKTSYGVIPCQECLRYEMSKETYEMEDAFMFILPNNDGSSTIVYENLNIDRSTLLFRAEQGHDMDAARQVFTFMNGMDINKRSSLRSKWIKMKGHGIVRYKSLNHTDFSEWKYNLTFFCNYRWF